MPAEYGEALSERELEIVALVAEGLTNREIAAQIFLSPNTVKVHLRNIFTKTGVASRTELSMLAVQEGWIVVPGSDTVPASESAPMVVVEISPPVTETPPPSWPRSRWITLGLATVLALLILWLPLLPRGQAQGEAQWGALSDPAAGGFVDLPGVMEDGWVEVAPLTLRRARMGMAAIEGRLYVVGGLSEEGPVARLDSYDIEADRWTSGTPRPLALANVQAVALDAGLLVPGGCDAQGQPVATTHLYDPAEDAWREVAPLPEPLCAYALAGAGEYAYLLGGWDGQQYRALAYHYDAAADRWEALPAPAEARGFGGAALLGTRLFYVGGFAGEELSRCEVYSLTATAWRDCAPLLAPRGGLGLAALGGSLYAVGGGWTSYLGFNERYNPGSDSWTVLQTPLVGEWRNLGLAAWEMNLYAVGGWSGDYLNRTYTLEILPFRVFIPTVP